ncbi:hypothetical protein DPMN_073483 [Dreissena polymorpha]|uniref:HTH psq-type domain-containing protein n=1 Tax=Dreissena polymorpha TaxID=45954 RepID=A0A9D4BZ94_DREPO|nr:hypothetical protein DPMN_073483 [Dreissena polymorpha]
MVNMTLVSLLKAYGAVKNKDMSVYRAARLYGIPESTLRDRTLGLQPVPCSSEPLPKPGPQNLVSVTEEEQFVFHVTATPGVYVSVKPLIMPLDKKIK